MGVVETELDWSPLKSKWEQVETLFPRGEAEKWAEAGGHIRSRKFGLFVCFQGERLFITCLHADGNDPVKRGKMRREQKRRVEEFQ